MARIRNVALVAAALMLIIALASLMPGCSARAGAPAVGEFMGAVSEDVWLYRIRDGARTIYVVRAGLWGLSVSATTGGLN